jgi:uncharacterized Zn finger protein
MKTYKIKCDNCDNEEMVITRQFIDNEPPEQESVDLKDWVVWEEPEPVSVGKTIIQTADCMKCGRSHKQGVKYKKAGVK